MALHANGFDWDKGNRAKCEKPHSQSERRFRAIGRTEKGRGVFLVFTLRRKGDEVRIRPISARYMHRKETEAYEKENPNLQE